MSTVECLRPQSECAKRHADIIRSAPGARAQLAQEAHMSNQITATDEIELLVGELSVSCHWLEGTQNAGNILDADTLARATALTAMMLYADRDPYP